MGRTDESGGGDIMTIDTLISRLDGVKKTGADRYLARCPAHDDRSPSLSIAEGDDGRALIHCFAGCEPLDILDAVGMTFSDIMPERRGGVTGYGPVRNRILPREALEALDHEALVIAVIASDIQQRRDIDEPTWARLSLAVQRINDARNACCPARVSRRRETSNPSEVKEAA